MSDHDSDGETEQELDLSNSDVVTKYKAAADICNRALAAVIEDAKAGAKIVDLCTKGDSYIVDAVSKVFKGKSIEKGVAFPTCVSINSLVGHVSPPAEDTAELKDGDLVKIDLAAHIDGFIATAAHSLVVQADPDAPVTGPAADLLAATNTALDAALRLFRPGKHISDVADTLQKIADAYGVSIVEGVLSHQMKQYVIDGNKCVLNKPMPEARVEDAEFEENEVYAIDVVFSTGEGKPKMIDEKETMVFKRALEETYQLKMKASRSLFSEVNKRYPTMPFTLRALDNKQSRFGLVELLNHGLLYPYPVLHEKKDALVAQFKATVLLMPNGSDRVTSAPLQKLETEKSVADEEIVKLLASSLKSKPKKKSKKKKEKAGAADGAEAAADVPEAVPMES